MAVIINGSGTITGLAAGGLPDGSVQLADLATTGTASSSTFLRGDGAFAEAGGGKMLKAEYGQSTSGYSTNSNFPQDAFSFTFTPTSATSQIIITMSIPVSLNIHTSIQLYGRFAVTKNDDTQLAGAVLSQQHDYMNRHSSGHAPTCSDHLTMIGKDTPGSTSQQTYKVRYGRVSGYSHRVAILDESVGSLYGSMWSIIEFE